ncbi:hypothetical protein R3P38DRAFT_3179378 [Favolaschia claudopus]|uniref:Uncharacterized protein n=1 Tax=Favolaschia claudopus TaxID=2862362 RepID=A0AAW0CWE7_9AGAR
MRLRWRRSGTRSSFAKPSFRRYLVGPSGVDARSPLLLTPQHPRGRRGTNGWSASDDAGLAAERAVSYRHRFPVSPLTSGTVEQQSPSAHEHDALPPPSRRLPFARRLCNLSWGPVLYLCSRNAPRTPPPPQLNPTLILHHRRPECPRSFQPAPALRVHAVSPIFSSSRQRLAAGFSHAAILSPASGRKTIRGGLEPVRRSDGQTDGTDGRTPSVLSLRMLIRRTAADGTVPSDGDVDPTFMNLLLGAVPR